MNKIYKMKALRLPEIRRFWRSAKPYAIPLSAILFILS
jgi:hypothetical protein